MIARGTTAVSSVSLPSAHGPLAALRGAGTGATGASALLVPGYTGSKEDFAPLLDGIASEGISPVALDLPGQHESPGPEDPAAYLPDPLGAVVAELVATLTEDGPVLLLGHSYGGLVARAAVLAGAPVAGLTLLGSGPAALPPGPRHDALHTEPACLLGMADGLRGEPDRTGDLAAVLRRRNLPGLVLAGQHDDAWSVPDQRDMARRLGTEFVTVPDSAHSPNTENPRGLLAELLPRWRGWLAGR